MMITLFEFGFIAEFLRPLLNKSFIPLIKMIPVVSKCSIQCDLMNTSFFVLNRIVFILLGCGT